jgi:hypothetical protein
MLYGWFVMGLNHAAAFCVLGYAHRNRIGAVVFNETTNGAGASAIEAAADFAGLPANARAFARSFSSPDYGVI